MGNETKISEKQEFKFMLLLHSSNQMHFAYTRNRHLGCMQDTFARATHSAGQARRATIGYLVYKHLGLSVNGSVRSPRGQVTHALHDF